MLSLPQLPFLGVGLLEALAAASGMAAGTMLSGASIPILSQTFLVWQLLLSIIFLGRRYNINQLVGCLLVSMGVIITVTSGSGAGPSLNDTGIFWSILMMFSFLLQAGDTILKELIFLNAAKRLKGGTVDIFVVNSFGSAYQALFICLLLPFLSKMWGIPFSQLPSYLKDGAACFLNINTLSTGCNGAPLLPVLFVIVNMCFNISLLHLLRISSAVVSCLASTVSGQICVPIINNTECEDSFNLWIRCVRKREGMFLCEWKLQKDNHTVVRKETWLSTTDREQEILRSLKLALRNLIAMGYLHIRIICNVKGLTRTLEGTDMGRLEDGVEMMEIKCLMGYFHCIAISCLNF